MVGLVAGVLAAPFFGVFDGTEIDMVTRPDPQAAVETMVAEQERLRARPARRNPR